MGAAAGRPQQANISQIGSSTSVRLAYLAGSCIFVQLGSDLEFPR
jgi:hypothetical protein